MKFSFARNALALAASLSLASCGGGGKATYPINVTVTGQTEAGLVLSTNGTDYSVPLPAAGQNSVTFVFPKQVEYGEAYSVVPKGATLSGNTLTTLGTQPAHQTCQPSTVYPHNLLVYGTGGQLASVNIYYDCAINTYPLGGSITGLTADGLVLANGNNDILTVASGATSFIMNAQVPYNTTFGVSVLTQPTGLTCSVSGGNGSANNGTGIMDDAASKNNAGVTNLVVSCVPNT
ncbi:hypothetical protein [Massilia sp. 9096]|uniref:hypothetical protein n=1 Tax=Massilia sp. 9096 TaxID=1500894 RepID=UPI0005653035|nr:hypothetical protein [Massilia sp. 9096]